MNIIRRILSKSHLNPSLRKYSGKLFEPDYLEGMKSEVPLYDTLNIQLRGYDYPILESYQKYLHNLIKNMDINVEDSWPLPPQHLQVVTYKPKSQIVNAQYNLKIYDRTIQITDVVSYQLPLLMRIIESSTPAGVTVNIVPHEDYHDEVRYIPDTELQQLKQELEDMGGPRKK